MRVLQIGDLHISSGEYADDVKEALENALTLIEEERVNLVVVAGDVFDSASTPSQRLMFQNWLVNMPSCVEQTLVIRGNHDQKDDLRIFGYDGMVTVHEDPKVELFDGLQILTLPHFNPSLVAREELSLLDLQDGGTDLLSDILDLYFQKVRTHNGPSIVIAHADVDGAEYREGYIPKSNGIHLNRTKLEALGCPVMLGHIHKHQKLTPNVVYSGSIARLNFGEANDDKGCVVWEYEPANDPGDQ